MQPNVDLEQVTAHAMLMTWQCALVGLPDAVRSAMLIGHNPALEDLVRMLTGRWVTLKTSTVARIDLDIASWGEMEYLPAGDLVYVLGVDEMAASGSTAEASQP